MKYRDCRKAAGTGMYPFPCAFDLTVPPAPIDAGFAELSDMILNYQAATIVSLQLRPCVQKVITPLKSPSCLECAFILTYPSGAGS